MDGLRHAPGRKTSPPIGRVLQDSSLYLLGNIASRAVGFLAIPFYARFLSPAQYGLVELVELSTQTIAIALGLQAIGAALSRLFHDQPTHEHEQAVVSTSLIATAVLSALVTVMAVAGAGTLSRLVFHSDEWTGLLRAAFVAMFFSNMTEVVLVYERIRNNARFFLRYTLVTLAANLGLNILFIGGLDAGVWGFVSSKLVVSTLGSAFLGLRMQRDVGWHFRRLYVPELIRFGAPLVLSSLSYFAIHFSDRFFLSASVSLAELGRYALAYKFAILVSALVGDSFAKSWNATLYRYTRQDQWKTQFARVASYFSFVLFATGLGIALFSPELLRIMVPADYLPPRLLLPIIIAAYLAREIGDFFRSLLLINKRSGTVGQIALGGAVLNLLANLALIPTLGIYGAAIATLVTWFAYMLTCWAVANREHRLPVRTSAYVRMTLLVVFVYGLAAGTRVNALVPQLMLDAFWLLLFAGLAAAVFFTPEERQSAFEFACTLGLRWMTVAVPGSEPGPPLPGEPWRLLLVAYYYPPQNEIGAARPHRFARWLRRAGVEVTVVTSASPTDAAAADDVEVLHASTCLGLAGTAGRAMAIPRRVQIRAAALGHLERLLMPYDDRLVWLPHAIHVACSELRPGTVLVSSHPPTVTHLVALALKQRCGLPWVADFRDPLFGNPYRTSQRAAWLDPLVERFTVEQADAVIANTEASAEVLRQRYPAVREKFHVIWNGYDPDDVIAPVAVAPRKRRVLAHIGTLYGDRTLLPVLLSMERLFKRGTLDPEQLQVRQVGRADPACLDLNEPSAAALTARNCLVSLDRNLPRAEAVNEMVNADWLLLLDMNARNPGLQVPAKLYEYVRAGRPILAITVPGSSTESVLSLAGVPHACLDLHAPPDMFDAGLLAFLQSPILSRAPTAAFSAAFSAPNQARQLSEIIEGARARNGSVHPG